MPSLPRTFPALDLANPFLQEAFWMSPKLGQVSTLYMGKKGQGDEAGPKGQMGKRRHSK